MWMLPDGLQVFIATEPMDMRKSFDGMAAIVQQTLKKKIQSGNLFVFLNKRGDKVKVFYWDRNGFAMWYKRLERGIFRLPQIKDKVFKVSLSELNLILEGIDLHHEQRLRAV